MLDSVLAKCPENDPSKISAWRQYIEVAIVDNQILNDYTHSTGKKVSLTKGEFLDLMDDASEERIDAIEDMILEFVDWFNKEIWGTP